MLCISASSIDSMRHCSQGLGRSPKSPTSISHTPFGKPFGKANTGWEILGKSTGKTPFYQQNFLGKRFPKGEEKSKNRTFPRGEICLLGNFRQNRLWKRCGKFFAGSGFCKTGSFFTKGTKFFHKKPKGKQLRTRSALSKKSRTVSKGKALFQRSNRVYCYDCRKVYIIFLFLYSREER